MVQFRLDLPPTVNNGRYLNNKYVLKPAYRKYIEEQYLLVPRSIKKIVKPHSVSLTMAFHLYRDADIDSRIKPVLDAMNKRLYDDDSQVCELHVYKIKVDKGKEGVFIKVGYADWLT